MSFTSIYLIGNLFAALFLFSLILYLHYVKHTDILWKDLFACAAISFGSWITIIVFLFYMFMTGVGCIFKKIESMNFWNKRIF